MTSIEWARGPDGSPGISWNALRAEREIVRRGETVTVSANHCEHVNEACRNCYAGPLNLRLGGLPFKPGHRKDYRFTIDIDKLMAPLKRKKPTRYFVESMSDAFGEWWPQEFVDKLYAVMAATPQHTYVNLSKRPERRRKYLGDHAWYPRASYHLAHLAERDVGFRAAQLLTELQFDGKALPNVIEGVSVSNQAEADAFVPELLMTMAAVRAVSAEPLLGPIDFGNLRGNTFDAITGCGDRERLGVWEDTPCLDWVIVGGESGRHARPMHPDWARSIRDQCAGAGVAFFHKQNGMWVPYRPHAGGDLGGDMRAGRVRTVHKEEHTDAELCQRSFFRGDIFMARVDKKSDAGRLLDGVEHNGFPVMEGRGEIAA